VAGGKSVVRRSNRKGSHRRARGWTFCKTGRSRASTNTGQSLRVHKCDVIVRTASSLSIVAAESRHGRQSSPVPARPIIPHEFCVQPVTMTIQRVKIHPSQSTPNRPIGT
jgi:hypothetical protein